MDVAGLARDRQVLVVLGDGGVGKTTVAAAMAARLALSGRRVLAVTVDPANRLKDALGLSGRPGVEEPVSLAALGPITPGGTLSAMVLDTATELDRLVLRVAPTDEARRRIMDNVFYRKAVTRMAGTHEYMAMERLLEALESGRYDLVVLDVMLPGISGVSLSQKHPVSRSLKADRRNSRGAISSAVSPGPSRWMPRKW